ncbi:MAG: alpha-hydroxy-acid oxidizing protein [Chloroflexi bacterium]|nr:alpha-hydroxy-acid oxidizing protein [Chloroflexota bacterium]
MTTEKTVKNPQTLSELFNLAKENLKAKGLERQVPSASNYQASSQLQRKLLDAIFMESRYLEPVAPDTGLTLFGVKMKTPTFCTALSKPGHLSDEEMVDLVRGMGKSGSMMILGIGGSELLQSAIDTGAPVVKMVKPYRTTDLIYEKVNDAAKRGCVAVGMDIDHFYGGFRDGSGRQTDTYAPKKTDEIRQAISATKLPFIIKGILSIEDAKKAVEMGASAVMVSNHGWGAFDFGVPSIVALPKVAKAVGGQVTVLADSGFRTGNDVFKALALGAKGVGFATSIVMAASAGGAEGIEQFIGFITAELKRTMAICGCPDLSAIDRSLLVASPEVREWW